MVVVLMVLKTWKAFIYIFRKRKNIYILPKSRGGEPWNTQDRTVFIFRFPFSKTSNCVPVHVSSSNPTPTIQVIDQNSLNPPPPFSLSLSNSMLSNTTKTLLIITTRKKQKNSCNKKNWTYSMQIQCNKQQKSCHLFPPFLPFL